VNNASAKKSNPWKLHMILTWNSRTPLSFPKRVLADIVSQREESLPVFTPKLSYYTAGKVARTAWFPLQIQTGWISEVGVIIADAR